MSLFEEFWARYPRKVGKGAARRAYDKAMVKARHDDVMFALSEQIPALEAKEQQFRPHASTWLNGERWDDEPEQPSDYTGSRHADATARGIAFAGPARRSPSLDSF